MPKFTVTKADGSPEEVELRKLSVLEYERLLKSLGDEPAMASMFCGKCKAWCAGLDIHSLFALVDAGQDLNPEFFTWAQRRVARTERVSQGINLKIAQSMQHGGN